MLLDNNTSCMPLGVPDMASAHDVKT